MLVLYIICSYALSRDNHVSFCPAIYGWFEYQYYIKTVFILWDRVIFVETTIFGSYVYHGISHMYIDLPGLLLDLRRSFKHDDLPASAAAVTRGKETTGESCFQPHPPSCATCVPTDPPRVLAGCAFSQSFSQTPPPPPPPLGGTREGRY